MDLYTWFRRNKKTSLPLATTQCSSKQAEKEDELYGVTDELIDLIKSFTLDTFRNYPLQDEEGANCGEIGAQGDSGNVQKDLSDWQERHAILVLSKVKELSQLRFRLCPGYLKERQFWRIYFSLVKNCLAEYELRAIRLEKLRQMAIENEKVSDSSACEVEMLETKQPTRVEDATSMEQNLDS